MTTRGEIVQRIVAAVAQRAYVIDLGGCRDHATLHAVAAQRLAVERDAPSLLPVPPVATLVRRARRALGGNSHRHLARLAHAQPGRTLPH